VIWHPRSLLVETVVILGFSHGQIIVISADIQ